MKKSTKNMSTSDEHNIASDMRGCETLTVKSAFARTPTNHQHNTYNKCNFHNNINKRDRTRQTTKHPLPYLTCTDTNLYKYEDKFRRNTRRRSTLWSLRSNVTTFVFIILFSFVTTTTALAAKNKIPLFETDATKQDSYKTTIHEGITLRTAVSQFNPISNRVSVTNLDFQTLKYIEKWGDDVRDVLLISGRNFIYMVNRTLPRNADEIEIIERLSWKPSPDSEQACQTMGKKVYECHNFIRVVELQDDGILFVCGTNAYAPACRSYNRSDFNSPSEDVNSVYLVEKKCRGYDCPVPYNPTTSSATLYANTSSGYQLFSALTHSIMSTEHMISKRKINSATTVITTSSKWLNKPTFIKILEYGEKVYIFFREYVKPSESGSNKEVVYSRIAQVCKDDMGGQEVLYQKWTTFLKARLTCNPPGDGMIQFNNLTSVSDIKTITTDNGQQMDVIYATFSTPWDWGDLSVSAVCMFPISENIESVFQNGYFLQEYKSPLPPNAFSDSFKSQVGPMRPSDVPLPRPGGCSNQYEARNLFFAQDNPLMYTTIKPAFDQPIFVTQPDTRVTEIAVDDNAGEAGRTMIYLGTENGKLLKLRAKLGSKSGPWAVLIEKANMAEPERCVNDMCGIREIHLTRSSYGPAAFIAFTDYMVNVPMIDCSVLPESCCSLVPDCGWAFSSGTCITRTHLNNYRLLGVLEDNVEWPKECNVQVPTNDLPTEIPSEKCDCSKKKKKAPCKDQEEVQVGLLQDIDDPFGSETISPEILELIDADFPSPGDEFKQDFEEVFTNRIMARVERKFKETMSSLADGKQRNSLKQQLEDVMVSTANLVLANHQQEYCLPTPTVNHLTHVYPLLMREIELWHQTALKKMTHQSFAKRCWSQSKFSQPCTTKITFSVPLLHVLWEPLSKLITDFQGECRSIPTKTTVHEVPVAQETADSMPKCKPLIGLQSCKDARSSLPHCQPKLCTFPKYSIDVRSFFKHANESRKFLENGEDVEPLWKPVNVTISENESIHGHLEVHVDDQPFTIDYSPVAEKVKISFRYAAIRDCSLSDSGCAGSGTRCNPNVENTIDNWYRTVTRKMTLKMRDCEREIERDENDKARSLGSLRRETTERRSPLHMRKITNIVTPTATRCRRNVARLRAPSLDVWKNIVIKAQRVGGVYRKSMDISVIEFYSHMDVVKFFKNMCSFGEPDIRRSEMSRKIMKSRNKHSLVRVMATTEAPMVLTRDNKTNKHVLTFFTHRP